MVPEFHAGMARSILLQLCMPRFTILRLLGSVTIVVVGCCGSTLLASASEGFVTIVTSVGSAFGLIFRGPLDLRLGLSGRWLLMGVALIVALIISLG
ncbi:hypothetical protein N9B17_01320 [Rhodopirellula sp.]|nr:hypothetical protein [Rhodopirellula sp.]